MTDAVETIQTDVLVVGGGGAACRAALEAEMAGAGVILAMKGTFAGIGIRGSGSTAGGVSDRGGPAYPGIPAIQGFEKKDAPPLSIEKDFSNIIQLGLGMTDRKLARVLSEQANDAMGPLLQEWSGEVIPRQWGMKSHGVPIMFGLTRMLRKSSVRIMENTMVVDLLLNGGRIAGAIAVDEVSGRLTMIRAGAVILGTGGKGNLFKHTLTSRCTSGDGYAMGLKAGAELMNMEFKQVFPGVIHPTINHFSAWFFVPHVKITNALGEEYIHEYLPEGITIEDVYNQRSTHGPFSARDSASKYFDVATMIETKEGRANEHDALELRNMLLVGEILAKTTRMRKESRGDLFREDYPERDDDNWLKVIRVNRKGEDIDYSFEAIDPDWGRTKRPEDMEGIHWG